MANQNSNYPNSTQNVSPVEQDVEVLYQKLGDRWFAFSIIADEVFMAPISDDQIFGVKPESTPIPEA